MKYPGYQYGKDPVTKQRERMQVSDVTRLRGTPLRPSEPRDVFVQSAPRGLFVTWKLPEDGGNDISGWRIYKGDENTLFDQVKDRANRQKFIDATAGTTPPVTNIFVSSVNAYGLESGLIQAQGKAIAETSAPTFPEVPPGYNEENSGGADLSDTLAALGAGTYRRGL